MNKRAKTKETTLPENMGNVGQIREILFGAQLRDFTERFDRIEANLKALGDDLGDRIERAKELASEDLRVAVDGLEKKIKSLTLKTDEDSTDLKQQIDRLNEKFSNNITALDESLDEQTTSIRNDLAQAKDKLQEETRTLKAFILEELEQHFAALREAKVSKDDMAEMLFELGMRLKGTDFMAELEEAEAEDVDLDATALLQHLGPGAGESDPNGAGA